MPTNTVVLGVACFLSVVVILSLYSIPAVSARISRGPISCTPHGVGAPGPQVLCCQTETDSATGISINWCTLCDDTEPPSNCGPRFQAHGGGNPTVGPTQPGTGFPNTGAIPNGQTGQPGHLGTALPSSGNNTGTLPVNNNTGTLPPGSIIKVPPGTIGSATNPPPTNNNTGNPIAMKSTDNPPGCSKKVPIPPNCTLNPFNNSAANKAEQTQQTTGHHVKGSTDASTSTGGNSTGH
ncbi:MAG TPA: hypothetical protein VFI73_03545 [Candidatus Nitrosopolaris sp.]|nr:hypothetical protein [Candidatus Nitrosopolaris sp.]